MSPEISKTGVYRSPQNSRIGQICVFQCLFPRKMNSSRHSSPREETTLEGTLLSSVPRSSLTLSSPSAFIPLLSFVALPSVTFSFPPLPSVRPLSSSFLSSSFPSPFSRFPFPSLPPFPPLFPFLPFTSRLFVNAISLLSRLNSDTF